jgi:zinc-ribbon domain
MQPEISLRCSSCGAAVREPAMFCPECGKPLATAATGTEPVAEVAEIAATPATNAEPLAANKAQTSPRPDESIAAATDPEPGANQAIQPDETGAQPGARGRTRKTLHRASTAARGAIGDNVKRVEKIHHVSSAMFEEAHYDPSLRFVLVALGLFVVFVVLLVVNKVMG